MGCALAKPTLATDATTAEVEKQLQEAQDKEQYQFKILLLGAGESGKSTVVKQVKLIYKGVVTAKEKEEYTSAIRRNVIDSMQTMLDAMESFGIELARPGSGDAAARVRGADAEAALSEALAADVTALWADEGLRACYERRDEFWLLDASQYYFEEAMRLAEPDYEPTDEDMIMTRIRTTGIVVTEFEDKPYSFSLVDVGGQRSERRKWIHCFDDVKAIIFLEGLSGYHQVLFEDTAVNRMHESLQLFEEVVKNPIFTNTPIFVFLNKKDLFEQMIVKTSLKVCFPEYDGPDGEVRPALEYIEKKYTEVMDKYCLGKGVNVHVVAARVRMDMKIAFGEVKEQIKAIYAERAGKKKKKQ
eukprot:TRINITY_DN4184_c0_g1_i1.p1 TRINITY_DN4184_c0_g1~~TRINITY_DN4184_c0_g1_i1.p1  ORF type:complete len:358 (-),score=131.00 TRINITY_DN4184_c0_g1_i1:797-1870(-)